MFRVCQTPYKIHRSQHCYHHIRLSVWSQGEGENGATSISELQGLGRAAEGWSS